MTTRYFKTSPTTHESIRNAMDTASGYPSDKATTWFAPADKCFKATDGNCVIAVTEEIAQEFEQTDAIELTEQEYKSYFPDPEPML